MKYLMGIDIGTSKVKVGLFNLQGEFIDKIESKYNIKSPKFNYSEVEPYVWWKIIKNNIKALIKKNNINKNKIMSVGISSLCPALIAFDKHNEPLRPAIIFYDQRSIKEAEEIISIIPQKHFNLINGNKIISGTSSLTSIYWIKNNEPHIYNETRIFGHANTYIASQLTGNLLVDKTNASYMGAYNIKEYKWEKSILKSLKLDYSKFPKVVSSTKLAGKITSKASLETGLAKGTPVAIGGADTACSAFALDIIEDNKIFESVGTSGVLTLSKEKPFMNTDCLNRCHVIDNHWLIHGAMSTPGATFEWLINEIAIYEKNKSKRLNISPYDLISNTAKKSPPGANGLIFLPYMKGERTPIWDSEAKGVLFGLTINNERSDIFRSVIEGICYGTKHVYDTLKQNINISPKSIISVGGASKNNFLNQIKSDILQTKIETYNFQETAMLGAAILGGISAKEIINYNQFIKSFTFKNPNIFESNKKHYDIYMKNFKKFKRLYPILKQEFIN